MLRSDTALRFPAAEGFETDIFDSAICSRNWLPTAPVAPRTATEICVFESASAACAARSALEQSSDSTQIEIWRSDEPCAIALMLMPALAIALVNVAPVPGRNAIPSPTIATTEWPYSVLMLAMRRRCSSRSKAIWSASVADSADASSTTMQMDDSADACVCNTVATPACRSAAKRRSTRSGTLDVPVPSTVSSATLLIEVIPLMGDSASSSTKSPGETTHSASEHARPSITVPGWLGSKTLRT
mmetsp:Transcript_25736/g.60074  ORF Transcript_25736/g.60074 Transcript_25736/m.60074 type:complete len:244 (+) Transcript_25736:1101-1832(+)